MLSTTPVFRGLMLTDTDELFTVSSVFPEIAPTVAVIVLLPAATPLTGCGSPAVPIVATPVLPLVQVAWVVTSFCELSLYVPVAVKFCVAPTRMVGVAGVTAMLLSDGVSEADGSPDEPQPQAIPSASIPNRRQVHRTTCQRSIFFPHETYSRKPELLK